MRFSFAALQKKNDLKLEIQELASDSDGEVMLLGEPGREDSHLKAFKNTGNRLFQRLSHSISSRYDSHMPLEQPGGEVIPLWELGDKANHLEGFEGTVNRLFQGPSQSILNCLDAPLPDKNHNPVLLHQQLGSLQLLRPNPQLLRSTTQPARNDNIGRKRKSGEAEDPVVTLMDRWGKHGLNSYPTYSEKNALTNETRQNRSKRPLSLVMHVIAKALC